MTEIDFIEPYLKIQDKHGAIASIYYKDDQIHEVYYEDNNGVKFFTEQYDHLPIETVEDSVRDWALGKRILSL